MHRNKQNLCILQIRKLRPITCQRAQIVGWVRDLEWTFALSLFTSCGVGSE